jgi:hypothetical protein
LFDAKHKAGGDMLMLDVATTDRAGTMLGLAAGDARVTGQGFTTPSSYASYFTNVGVQRTSGDSSAPLDRSTDWEVRMIEAGAIVCPRCGGATRHILYGLPDPDAFDEAERGEIELGGCLVHDLQPNARCTECHVGLRRGPEGWEVMDPPAFLLTWNPERWSWPEDHRQATITITGYGDAVTGRWSTGIRGQGIHPGDWLYLVRQGTERGIVGWAVATSEIYEDDHYADAGRTMTYGDLEWQHLLDTEDRLPVEVLQQTVPGIAWNSLKGSGVRPSPEDADALEAAWNDHVGGLTVRWGDDRMIRDLDDLMALTGGEVETHIDWFTDYDGDIWLENGAVEFSISNGPTFALDFPFTVAELYRFADEVAAEIENAEDEDE